MSDDNIRLPEIKGDSTKPVEIQQVDVELMDEPKDNFLPENVTTVMPEEEKKAWEEAENKANEIYKEFIPLEVTQDDVAKLQEQEKVEDYLQTEEPEYYEWYKKAKKEEEGFKREQASTMDKLRQDLVRQIYEQDKEIRDLENFEIELQNKRYDDMSTGGIILRTGAGVTLGGLDVIYDFIKTAITDPLGFRIPDDKGLIAGLAAPAFDFVEKAVSILDTRNLFDYDPEGPRWGDATREWAENASDKDEKIFGLSHINALLEIGDNYNKEVRDLVPILKQVDALFYGVDEDKQESIRNFMNQHFEGTTFENVINELADGLNDNIKGMFAHAQAAVSIPASPGFEEVFTDGETPKFGLLNPFGSEEALRWWLANIPQGLGSSLGFIVNMRLMGGALKNMNISQNTKAAIIAIGATHSESVMIGDQVFKHSLLMMVPEYSKEIGDQVEKIKAVYGEYLKEYENKELAAYHMQKDIDIVIEEGLRNLPDEAKQKIITDAQKAREYAIKFNNATAVFNFTMSKLVLGGKAGMKANATKRILANAKDLFSRNSLTRLEALTGLSRTALVTIREMLQEAIEEGPMNTGAEVSGNQRAKYLMWDNPSPYLQSQYSEIELASQKLANRPFTITDFETMIGTAQMQNSALLGSITSGMQTTGTQFSNEYLFHSKTMGGQSRAITELQKIVKNIGDPKLLEKYSALNSQYNNLVVAQQEIDALNSIGNYKAAAELAKNLLSEQARFALQWNAMDNLIKYYNKIANTKSLSPDMRQRAAEAVNQLHEYKKMWDSTDGKANRNDIFINRVNNDIYRKQIVENEQFVQELESIENKTQDQQDLLTDHKEALANLKLSRSNNTKKWVAMTSHSFQQQLQRKDDVINDVQEYINKNDSFRKSEEDFIKDVKTILKRADISYINKYILRDIEAFFGDQYQVQHAVLSAKDMAEMARRGEEVDVDISTITAEEYVIKKQKEKILETIDDSGKKLEGDDRLLSPPEKRQKGRSEKSKLKNGTKKLYDSFVEKFKSKPTFKELVQDAIDTYGVNRIRGTGFKGSLFSHLFKGWHLNGYTPLAKKKAQKLYDKMFTDQDEGISILETIGDVKKTTVEQQKEDEKDETEKKEQEKSGEEKDLQSLTKQIVKGFTFFVFKHKTKGFITTLENALGYKKPHLNGDPFLGVSILDANKMKVGTKLEIKIPRNAEQMLITYVDEVGKRIPMTFGTLVKQKNLKPTDAEYIAYVPMIIYLGSDAVAYINSPSYFTSALAEKSVFKETEGSGKRYAIKKAQENSTKLRNKVSAESKATIEITKRSYKVSEFRTKAPKLTLRTQNPNALLGYTDQDGYIRTNKGIINRDDVILINEDAVKTNYKAAYHFVEYTIENGQEKAVYYVEPLLFNNPLASQRQLLDGTSVSSIAWALIAYATQFDTTGVLAEELGKVMKDAAGDILGKENFSKAAMDNLAIEIRKRSKNKNFSGFDVKQVDSLKEYLSSFVITNISTGSAEEVLKTVNANNKIPNGTPYIGVGGITMVIGVKGERNPDGTPTLPMMINPGTEKEPISRKAAQAVARGISNMTTRPATKEIWEKTKTTKVGAFYRFKINIGKKVDELTKFPITNANGKVMTTMYKTYMDGRLWSTMGTVNIGTEENPNHVINVEPKIDFKLVDEKESSVVEAVKETKKVKEEKKKEKKEKKENKKKKKKGIVAQAIDDAIDDLEVWGITIQRDNGGNIDGQMNPPDLNDEETKQKLRDAHSDKTNLLSYQKNAIVNLLRGAIIDKIEPGKKVSEQKINIQVLRMLKNWLGDKNSDSKVYRDKLKVLDRKNMTPAEEQFYDAVIKGYETVAEQVATVLSNYNLLINEAWALARKDVDIKTGKFTEAEFATEFATETEDENDVRTEEEEQQDNRDTNYTKTSIEENNKAKTPYKLKRFLEGFLKFDRDNNAIITFLGIQERYSADDIYDKIEEILSHDNDVSSSFEDMMDKLLLQAKAEPWIEKFVAKISDIKTDSDIRMGFVYHFAMHSLRMKVAVYTKNKNGGYSLQVQDSNANEMAKIVSNDWKVKLMMGSLTGTSGQLYAVDRKTANLLIEEYKELQKIEDKEDAGFLKQARNWLEAFGIEMSDEGWAEFVDDGYEYGPKKIPFKNHFGGHISGIFKKLNDTLSRIIAEEGDLTFEDNENNDIFFKTQEIKALARIEAKHSGLPSSKNFRDGDKSIYGYTAPKFATDRAAELRKNEDVLTKLLSMPFSKNSLWLRMLQKSKIFRETFDVEHIGPTTLREHSKSLKGVDMGVTKLADADIELAKLAMFTHNHDQIEKIHSKLGDISLRVARIFFPTMSDKSQMLTVNTVVLDLKSNDMDKTAGHPSYISTMYDQVVNNELERIINFHENRSTMQKLPDGYHLGAQIFHFIPELNNVTDGNGTRIIQLIAEGNFNENAKKIFEEKARNVLAQVVLKEKIKKINEWHKFGFIAKDKNGDIDLKAMPVDYMRKFTGSADKRVNGFAEEYVVNSIISNSNIFMAIAGDIAMFSTDKAFGKGKFNIDRNGVPIPYSPVNGSIYAKISESIIGVNLGKRLALLLAPGLKIANSKNDKYIQIFLDDKIDISPDIHEIVRLYYGITEADKVIKAFEGKTAAEKKILAKQFAGQYPDISAYFEIESTDGQEYSTMGEHIDIIYRQGRMKQELRDSIIKKYKQQVEITGRGEVIPKDIEFTDEELKVILQPIKPVYTGQVMDESLNTARTMYIKTSSFPLIPQLTKNIKLNKLRMIMEAYEKKSGMKVRATYFTGSKVGGMNKDNRLSPEQIEDIDETDFNSVKNAVDNTSLVLDRKYFRIQQDVPYKSTKREEDVVALGTQMLKLLFGDGILNIDKGFFYKGKELTGKELYNKYVEAFGNLVVQKKKTLYNELGVDEFGKTNDLEKSIKNLQRILREEAIEKNYPEQDVKALTLIADVILNGKDGTLGTYKLTTEDIEYISEASKVGVLKVEQKEAEAETEESLAALTEEEIAVRDQEIKKRKQIIEGYNKDTREKLEKLLRKDIVDAIENGEVTPTVNDIDFSIPLWLSPNSNRYESVLNGIVNKRLIKLKIPGNGFVVGSEEGFALENPDTMVAEEKAEPGIVKVQPEVTKVKIVSGTVNTKQAAKDDKGIYVMRPNSKDDIPHVNSKEHFGNPWSHGGYQNTIKTETIQEAVDNYKAWLEGTDFTDVQQERRTWILDQINAGIFNNQDMLYFKAGYQSHADVLAEYVNEKRTDVVKDKELKKADTIEGIPQDQIIWTGKYNGRELQGTLSKVGDVVNYAQVLVPSKFRMKDAITGKMVLIDMFQDFDGTDGLYVKKVGDRIMLKEGMFDADLLGITSFRIPTSSHVSLSQVEIVGFLPPSSGDLMIVPKGFITKKGLDFDVDKEFTYQMWGHKNEDGSFVALDKVHDVEKPGDNDIYEKIIVNDIIRIHQTVLGNPNDEVQKKINKVLSTDTAEKQAELLTNLSKETSAEGNKYFTLLSDMYQKEKMYLGSAGRVGIGVYSNYVVMHSLLQQTGAKHELSPGKNKNLMSHFEIGGLKSNGTLARENSLAGNLKAKKRSISEVLAEAQNTATDNEKLQTMGRTNINEHTINVHSIMMLLGFDLNYATKNDIEINVPYFFLSQPIIKRYVEIMNMHKSILSEDKTQYMSPIELKEKVIKELIARYKKIGEESVNSGKHKSNSAITADALVDNIQGRPENINGFMQVKVLEAFAQLDTYATDISNTQQKMTVSTKGLGKSLFEAADKYTNVIELATSSLITGTSNLVGDYMDVPDNDTEIKEKMDEGYVRFDHIMVKPTTPVGSILIHSSKASHDLWNRFFPYNHPDIQYVLDEGLRIFGKNEASVKQKTEAKHTIMKELRKYLFTNSALGLFKGRASETRKELFFDDGKHQSLANYLDKLPATMIKLEYDLNVRRMMINNPLLTRFNYTINKNGMPSLIKFNNTAGENLNENYLYNSLVELMLQDFELPPFNGQKYTTKKLAQDLIAYTYLEGGVQEAVQFAKYISVDYLNITAFGEKTRSWGKVGSTHVSDAMKVSLNRLLNRYVKIENGEMTTRVINSPEQLKDMQSLIQDINNEYGKDFVMYNSTNETITFGTQTYSEVLKTAKTYEHEVSRFGMQLAQHNPELLRKVEVDIKTGTVSDNNLSNADSKQVAKMQSFSYDIMVNTPQGLMVDEENKPLFLAVYNKNIKKSKNKYHVFYYNGEKYVRIPTLGVFGMNEYDQKKKYQKSDVNESDLKYSPTSKPAQEVKPQAIKSKFNVGGNVTNTLELIANNEFKTETGRIAAIVAQQILDSPALNTDITVQVKPIQELPDGSKPNGEYVPLVKTTNPDSGKILINSETIDNRSEDKFAATFIEEVLHSVTVETIDKYIESSRDENGKWEYKAIGGAPDFAIRMVRLFNKTRSVLDISDAELSQNTSELLDSKGDASEANYDRMLEIYRMSNIHEFIAGVFVDKNFRKKLGSINYKDTNISIIDRFKTIVMDIFTAIGIPFRRNSIGAQAMDSTLNWLADDTKATEEQEDLEKDDTPEGIFSPADKRSPNEKLEQSLIEFLDKLNVDVYTNGEQIMETFMNVAPGRNLIGAADILEKLIVVNKNRKYDTLPRMAAYMVYSLLGEKNHLAKQISNGVRQLDNYQKRYDYWRKILDKEGFKEDNYNHFAHNQVVIEFITDGLMTNFGKDLQPSKKRDSEDIDKEFFISRNLNLHWNKNKFMSFVIKAWNGIQKKIDILFSSVSVEELHDIMIDLADDIFNGETKKFMRGALMKNGYLDVNGQKRMLKDYESTIKDDPFAKKILQQMVGLGMKLTGSLAFRKFGTIFRSKEENLHDLDFDVPFEMTSQSMKEMVNIKSLMNKIKPIDQKAWERHRRKKAKGRVKFTSKEQAIIDRLFGRMEAQLEKTGWFKEVKKMYPGINMRPAYMNDNDGDYSGITWTGIIDGAFDKKGEHVEGTGYMVDFFVNLVLKMDNEYDGMFKAWKEIFKAKIRLGRGKDMQDLVSFIPFESSKYKFQDAGFRLFDFKSTNSNYTFVNNTPIRKFSEGPKKC